MDRNDNPYQSPDSTDENQPADRVPAEGPMENNTLGDFVPVYAARSLPEAQLLCDILSEQGIRAEVTNKLLEGGSGVDIVGWPTLPRVIVAQADAGRARELALEFDRRAIAAAKRSSDQPEEEPPDTSAQSGAATRPVCPQCGTARITRCPVCQTASSAFPPADANPLAPHVDVFDPAGATTGMACGPGGCCSATGCTPAGAAGDSEVAEELPAGMLLCTTCDEPFAPEYARRCEWCGHEFADGYDVDPPRTTPETITARMTLVIFALVGLLVAIIAYFASLV